MRTVLAVVSDTHAGGTTALCPPDPIDLDDGQQYIPSRAQRWLWQCWADYWDRVEEVRGSDELRVVLNGDLVDGPLHHGTHQSVSGQSAHERHIVFRILETPLSLKPDHVFVVRGTEGHVGKGGNAEEGIARSLKAAGHPVEGDVERNALSWYFLRMRVGAKLLEFTHHGRTGHRPWTRANAYNLLAAQIFYERYREDPNMVPDLAVRSHFHRYGDSHDAHPVRLIQTAAWQLATSYVHRKHPEGLADIGGHIVVVEGDNLSVEHVIFKPRRPAVWTKQAA